MYVGQVTDQVYTYYVHTALCMYYSELTLHTYIHTRMSMYFVILYNILMIRMCITYYTMCTLPSISNILSVPIVIPVPKVLHVPTYPHCSQL